MRPWEQDTCGGSLPQKQVDQEKDTCCFNPASTRGILLCLPPTALGNHTRGHSSQGGTWSPGGNKPCKGKHYYSKHPLVNSESWFSVWSTTISNRINTALIKCIFSGSPPPTHRPTESESLAVGPRHLHFNQTFWQFLLLMKFESLCSEEWVQSVVCYQIYPQGSVLSPPLCRTNQLCPD